MRVHYDYNDLLRNTYTEACFIHHLYTLLSPVSLPQTSDALLEIFCNIVYGTCKEVLVPLTARRYKPWISEQTLHIIIERDIATKVLDPHLEASLNRQIRSAENKDRAAWLVDMVAYGA